MANLRSLISKESQGDEAARKIAKPLVKEWPLVAEILGGSAATEKDEAISPGTITIFIHDGKARFSANVKSAQKTFIGDIADITKPWESINYALSSGEVSSKRYTERTPTQIAESNGAKLY